MFEYCGEKIIYIGHAKFKDEYDQVYERTCYKKSIKWSNKKNIWRGKLRQIFQNALEENYIRIIREEKLKRILNGNKH